MKHWHVLFENATAPSRWLLPAVTGEKTKRNLKKCLEMLALLAEIIIRYPKSKGPGVSNKLTVLWQQQHELLQMLRSVNEKDK
jgi:hypothetical protein